MSAAKEWDELCHRYEEARQEVAEAWGVVMPKFGAVAWGRSRENPTEGEMARLERAKEDMDAVDAEMRQFMRKHSV
jgi:hypothetical protein